METYKTNDIYKKNIQIIAETMQWDDTDLFVFTGSGYYFTWGNRTQKDVDDVLEKTGIQCSLSEGNILLVPVFSDFKSKREEELRDLWSQYGDTMFMIDLSKKCSNKELKILFSLVRTELVKRLTEDEVKKLINSMINAIS